ncbi:hypothetical protein QTP88_009820 [Uroleucon formosanum]
MKNMELKDFTTGTWNVRTLNRPGHLTTAILELEQYRLDIIAIQEKFKAVNDRICYIELECRWFNVILINGYAPTEDKEDEVKDIFYENLDNVCDRIPTNKNYRGISLLNTCYKVVSNIILNRIKPYTREIMREYQSGFMPGKSTVDQIHTIKQIVEKSHEFDIDVHLLFVDFKQAYDSVNICRLWKEMTQLGISTKLVRLIKTCVQKSKCKVKFNGELSEHFLVETGLRQRDALSPTLFNIALESVVREVLDDATVLRIGEGHQITLAAYADDIIIIGETEEDLKRLAEKLISKGKEIGLQVNEKKTKYLIVSRREQVQNSLEVGGFTFERVSNFKYLGVDVNQQANSNEEIKRRITA